jgi:hypothetical protein
MDLFPSEISHKDTRNQHWWRNSGKRFNAKEVRERNKKKEKRNE